MTVRELIERLSKYNDDLKVVFSENHDEAVTIPIRDVTIGSEFYGEAQMVYLWDE